MKRLLALLLLLPILGCGESYDLTLYTSVDQPAAQAVVDAFEASTGLKVKLVTDTEATKSVGLAERILAERSSPRADVWWSNEVFHTIRLTEENALQAYDSPSASDVPALLKDAEHRWASVGLRARVIGVMPDAASKISGLEDLVRMPLEEGIAIARPTAGTTGGHVAALYVLWGRDKADAFFTAMHDRKVQILGGNGPVAQQVASGQISAGLTDNDDLVNARAVGGTIEQILPDQGDDGIGTLVIPTTVALVAGKVPSDASRKLVDFLLSQASEQILLDRGFAAFSVRDAGSGKIKPMNVDYAQVARVLPMAVRRASALLDGRDPPDEAWPE